MLPTNYEAYGLGQSRQHAMSQHKLIFTLIFAAWFAPVEEIAQQQSVPSAIPRSDLPGFTVDVALSEKAKKKLIESKETIVVVSYFTGSPKPGASLKQYKRFLSRPGPIGLGDVEVEFVPGESARFGVIKLNRAALAQIDNKGPQLLINVVSGRKSSEDNLLACDIYEGALEPVQGTTIPIRCKLIEEAIERSPLATTALSKAGSSSRK